MPHPRPEAHREPASRRRTRQSTRPGSGATPAKKAKVPAYARAGRHLYALLASAFVAGVVVQVFFAGMGAFGADWSWHTSFVHLLELLPLLMVPVAFAGRLSWGLRLMPLGLLILIGAQYALANSAIPAAALHPVNALLIFLSGLFVARRAWAIVAEQRKG